MLAYHVVFLGLLVGTEALFTGLDWLNLRHMARRVRADRERVESEFGVDDAERLLDYHREKTRLSRLRSWVVLAVVLGGLYGGAYAGAVSFVDSLGVPPFARGTALVLGVVLGLYAVRLPFGAYDTFSVEERYGFNNYDVPTWLREQAVGLVVSLAITAALAAALFWLVGALPAWWWVAGVGLYLAFSLVMLVVYPRVVAPLFNDFEPVAEGDLADAVDEVFDRADFECEQTYVMDASKQSSKTNAYFVGFGRTKRVVLFDTLVEEMSVPEVQSVLAHELAHWKRHHVWVQLAAGTVEAGVALFLVYSLATSGWLYAAFGVPEATYAGVLLAALWVAPLFELASPLTNRLSLRHEREADEFATALVGGAAMADALRKLGGENYANPFPHPLYEAFHYDHPPLPERIRRVENEDEGSERASAA